MANGNTLSQEEFQNRVWKFNPHIRVVGKYISLLDLIKVRCDTCKHAFEADPQRLIYEQRGGPKAKEPCVNCKTSRPAQNKQSHEQVVTKLKSKRPDIQLLEPYKGVTKKHKFKQLVCGHSFVSLMDPVLNGSRAKGGCGPQCAHAAHRLARQKERAAQLRKIKPHIKIVSGLDQLKTRFRCAHDQHEWEAPLANVLRLKHACLMCAQLETGYERKTVTIKKRRFSVQGYEANFLRRIAKTKPAWFKEIQAGKDVPYFSYRSEDKVKRTYRPDFYVASENLIIEIKSTWTAAGRPEWFETLKRKRKAVRAAGYKFLLVVMDDSDVPRTVTEDWHKKKLTPRTLCRD